MDWIRRRRRKKVTVRQETNQSPGRPSARSHARDCYVTFESPQLRPFPGGVKVVQNCPNAAVDICFVHGLTGNRDTTWTAEGQSAPWIKTLLPAKLSTARILTYGYDAYVVRKSVASFNRLIDHAADLLSDLTADRAASNASFRPIIFVAHSLGGLVCKQAMLSSRNHPEAHLRRIFDCTIGIAFMGTPHKGSWMSDWARISVRALGLFKSVNKSLLEILGPDNETLEQIQIGFWSMIRERQKARQPPEVICFFEELPLPGIGKVVSKESATLEGYLSVSIHANHMDMVRFASAEDNGFKRLLGELVRWNSEVGKILTETAHDCLESLAFPRMQDRFHGIGSAELDRRRSGPALDQDKPGSGKSTLLKYALDNHKAEDGALVLSFFFHGRGDDLQRTPLGLFRCLLHQILGQAPLALKDLVDRFETKASQNGKPGESWYWHEGELRPFLESSLPEVAKTRQIWLFVDALDECGKENALRLVDLFKALLEQCADLNRFRICFSCRHYPSLDLDETVFRIFPEDENRGDISTFVNDRLAGFRARTSSTIPDLITERASGVFLWARLVVERILDLDLEGAGLWQMEQAVHSIPKDLDELYRQLIKGMDSVSLKLIQCICFATQPLSLDELRWAMILEGDCPHQSLQACQSAPEYESDNVRLKRRVLWLSRGLAEVTRGQLVQFIHQSVKDFFIRTGLPALDGCETPAEVALRAHFRLAKICIRYMAMEEIGQATRTNERNTSAEDDDPSSEHDSPRYGYNDFPFLRYAANSWVAHAKQCDAGSVPHAELLNLLAWPSNALVASWLQVCRDMKLDGGRPRPRKTSLVHVSSSYGMLGLSTAILQRADEFGMDASVDAKDGDGRTPLMWAAQQGHDAVVKLLLSTGKVNVNTRDDCGRTPLSHAASQGRPIIVKMLLGMAEVEVNARDNQHCWTPLWWATKSRHCAVVQLLLGPVEAEVDAKDRHGQTPLLGAAIQGDTAIVKLLLDTGKVDVNLKNNFGETLLLTAIASGHETVVKLLLDTGKVDINAKDDTGETPLSWAAKWGCGTVVRLLLDTGRVEVDAKSNSGRTPLLFAAWNGHDTIVKLLLDTGKVDVNAKDNKGHTPLSLAAKCGHEAAAKLLLDTNMADVNTKHGNDQTPLSLAAAYGRKDVVRLLLDTGMVDVNAEDQNGHTPLSLAAANGCEVIVRLLQRVR